MKNWLFILFIGSQLSLLGQANNNAIDYSIALKKYYQLNLVNIKSNSIVFCSTSRELSILKNVNETKLKKENIQFIIISKLGEVEYVNELNSILKLSLTPGDLQSNLKIIKSQFKDVSYCSTINSKYWFNKDQYLQGLIFNSDSIIQGANLLKFYQSIIDIKIIADSWKTEEVLLFKNLLPPLLTLYKLKLCAEQVELENLITAIAERTENIKKVNDLINEYK